MNHVITPEGYVSYLDLYQTQTAIGYMKRVFSENLATALNLKRVSAPLFVDPSTGLNDDLNGTERPVRFDIRATGTEGVVVHSLAKWKRVALADYGFSEGEGLYTDMNAIRRDEEELDNLHSVYVDQWDWEKIIYPDQRNEEYLRITVQAIADAICSTLNELKVLYRIPVRLERWVSFISSQELEDMYPGMTPKERENAYVREHKTVFITKIGWPLRSGKPHDGRAPDYDDWNLNGDLLFWHEGLGCALEISSMGIRVDPAAMDAQLTAAGCDDRRTLPFHRRLLSGGLPLTMGGGIGQSRLSMLLLGKVHIGEVQSSLWDKETLDACRKAGIHIL